jgi:hypothetical protein
VRRPSDQWRRLGGATWPVHKHHVARPGTPRRPAQESMSAAHGSLDTGRPRHACTAGTATCRRVRARAARRRRAGSALLIFHFGVAPFDQGLLKFLQPKCHKQSIPKLYTSPSSTTFVKGIWPFSQPFVHTRHSMLAVF